jgi:hypothetical protein
MKTEFDTSSIRSIRSAAITEFNMVGDNVARVIATFVGDMDKDERSDRLAAVLSNRARPIQDSFRWLAHNRIAMGYVSTAKAVRPYREEGYHRVNANFFVDQSDESLWELKPGQGGKYLSRQGTDNLAELLEASRVLPRGSTPRMNSILSASVKKDEFVAFVDIKAEMIDYGFCTSPADDNGYKVLSFTSSEVSDVPSDVVVGVYKIEIPQHIRSKVTPKTPVKASMQEVIDYYKRAYNFAPEYVEDVIKQIKQMSVM